MDFNEGSETPLKSVVAPDGRIIKAVFRVSLEGEQSGAESSCWSQSLAAQRREATRFSKSASEDRRAILNFMN